ncbi:PREDICTED: uncharacterized protein LOC104814117 [Tarenaya hassleriana]|uniref:uncharacterized protein LOC104814117 n=1 Tax=Tarenaya hassleriana TaxID=28532 RepID=UPI00053C8D17|nr:PREDICTED: uncharacterized protein LOC104814117 [Tarenaya hassleriana]
MAVARENLLAEASETAPLNGDTENRYDVTEEKENDDANTATFCGCGGYLRNFCVIRWRRGTEVRGGWNGDSQQERGESWAKEKLKELKEMSEKIAGPKWKNFIRRFSTNNKRSSKRNLDFTYDLRSYSLNFDDGERPSCDLPARFAAPVVKNGTEFPSDSSLL